MKQINHRGKCGGMSVNRKYDGRPEILMGHTKRKLCGTFNILLKCRMFNVSKTNTLDWAISLT